MRIKFIIAALVLIAASIFWYQSKETSPTEVINIQNLVEENKKIEKKSIKNNQEYIQEIKEEPVEVAIPFVESEFDDDPVVNATMIINKHKLCINQLAENAYKSKYMKLIQLRLDVKQNDYLVNLKKHCEKINQDHPEYNLSNPKRLRKQKENAVATSTWGKIIKGDLDVEDLKEYEIEDLLRQNSIAILSQAPKYLIGYYQEVMHWDLEDVLQSHQYDYILQIAEYSHQLYLCTIGDECGVQSSIMAGLCFYNAKSCGLTYPQYIESVLTQGQQADIQLALGYLHGKYN